MSCEAIHEIRENLHLVKITCYTVAQEADNKLSLSESLKLIFWDPILIDNNPL